MFLDPGLEVLLDVLQPLALGLRHELVAEPEGDEADAAVDPEGAGAAGRFDQQQEGQGDDEVEGPVRHRPQPGRLAAHRQRVDLGVDQPEDRPEADREGGDVGHQADDRDHRGQGAATAADEGGAEREQRDHHPGDADHQHRPPPGPVQQPQRQDREADVDDADPDRGQDRPGRGVDAGEFDDRRRVVDDRVDPGHLLQDRQPDADEQSRFDHRLQQLAPGPGLVVEALLDLLQLEVDRVRIVDPDLRQHRPRREVVAAHHQPARALRHPQHPEGQGQRRHAAEPEHPAPVLAVVEGEPDQVGDEDADRHRQLEEADQAAAALRRRHLGDVDGGGGGGEPDRDADHHPGDDQHLDPRRGGAAQRADDEDRRRDQDHQPPPVGVGRRPGDRGPADRPDRDRGDHHPLGEAAEVEVLLDEEQGAGDDPGVVAEQQAAEPRDRGREDHIAPRSARRRLRSQAHPVQDRISPRGRGPAPSQG